MMTLCAVDLRLPLYLFSQRTFDSNTAAVDFAVEVLRSAVAPDDAA